MKELFWVGPMNVQNGYGRATYEYVSGLHNAGVDLTLRNCDPKVELPSPVIKKLLEDSANKQSNAKVAVYHCDPNVLRGMIPDIHENRKLGIKNVSYTVFETDVIPAYWVKILRNMDMVIVPSEFVRKSFIKSGLSADMVKVVPHVISEPIQVSYEKRHPLMDNRFIFGSVFDFVNKKGWIDLLTAYWKSFSKNDDVCLVLKVYPSRFGYTDEGFEYVTTRMRALKSSLGVQNDAPVYYIKEFYDDEEFEALWKRINCFVLPTRGEGFGLPIAEAMKRGIPTIATDVGGHDDFFDSETGFPVQSKEEIIDDVETCITTPHYQDKKWRVVNVDELQKKMQYVYENYEEARKKAEVGKKRLDENYNEEIVIDKLIKVLDIGDSEESNTVKTPSFSSPQTFSNTAKKAHTRRPVKPKKEIVDAEIIETKEEAKTEKKEEAKTVEKKESKSKAKPKTKKKVLKKEDIIKEEG